MGWIHHTLDGVEILFSDRTGGVSAPPFATANLAFGRGDDPEAVGENRRRVGAALGGRAADPSGWSCLRQVHGAGVVAAEEAEGVLPPPTGDALVSGGRDAVLAVLTADCAPVALVGPGGFGAVHAGWRGVAGGVLEAAVERVVRLGGGPVRAVLGPCVRPSCYEFSPADLEPIASCYGPGVEGRTAQGRLALDLPAAVMAALAGVGVTDVTDTGVCTACSPDHFSHRRDGRSGLQAMLVAGRR